MTYEDFIENPNGTQFGGFNPTMTEYARRSIYQAQSQQLTRDLLMNDPRAVMQSQILASNLGMAGGMGDSGVLGVSSIINSKMMSNMMGGSRLDMFAGINAGFANSGRIMGNQGSFYGTGSMTNEFSKTLMEQAEKHFYNSSGGARLDRTQGLNRSDFGTMMAEFGSQGMLSGWGGYTTSGGGDKPTTMSVDTTTINKTKDIMSQGAKVISGLKDIMGDASMGELMKAMNSLAGGTVSSVEKLNEVKQRLEKIKSLASESGGSAEAYMSMHAQHSAAFRGIGIGGAASASMAMTTLGRTSQARSSMMAARQYGSSMGYDIPDMVDAVSVENMKDAAFLTAEKPEVNAMLYAINSSTNLSDDQRAALKSQIKSGLGGVTSQAELNKKIQSLSKTVFSKTGGSASSWNRAAGGNFQTGLTDEDTALTTEASLAIMDNRTRDLFKRTLSETGSVTGSENLERFAKYRDKFSMETLAKAASGKSVEGISQRDAGLMFNILNSRADLQNSQNDEDKAASKKAALVSMYAEVEFGEDLKGAGDVKAIAGTLLGDSKVTDAAIRRQLQTSGVTGRIVTEQQALEARAGGGFVDRTEMTLKDGTVENVWSVYSQDQKDKAAEEIRKSMESQTFRAAGISAKTYLAGSKTEKADYARQAISEKLSDGLSEEDSKGLAGLARIAPGAQNEILRQLKERADEIKANPEAKSGMWKKDILSESQQKELDEIGKLREQLVTSEGVSAESILGNIYSLLLDFNNKLPN